MKLLVPVFFGSFSLASSSRFDQNKRYLRKDIRDDEARLGLQSLGFSLLENSDGNGLVSPVSLAGILHLLAAGGVGDTRSEILEKALGINYSKFYKNDNGRHQYSWVVEPHNCIMETLTKNAKKGAYKFKSYTGLFTNLEHDDVINPCKDWNDHSASHQCVIKKDFIREYLGENQKVDFEESYDVLEAVNAAVNKATSGNFPNFLESIPPNTLMVALSALYIESNWYNMYSNKVFDVASAGQIRRNREHYCFRGSSSNCEKPPEWLKSEELPFDIYDDGSAQIIDLKLKSGSEDDEIIYTIVMPREMKTFDPKSISERVERAERVWQSQTINDKWAVVNIPTFEIKMKDDMIGQLRKIGVHAPFSPKNADFSHLFTDHTDSPYLKVLQHAATFSVSKDGIKASAATAAVFATRSLNTQDGKMIYVNKPFYFMLSSRSSGKLRAPLFVGKISTLV